ncbi:hypothetical protein FRC00_000462, partial [Tulasnella sp. 408]
MVGALDKTGTKTGVCHWCSREGHYEKECRKKKDAQREAQQGAEKSNQRRAEKKTKNGKGDENSPPDHGAWVATALSDAPPEEAKTTNGTPAAGEWWEFDSGATQVFHGNFAAFSDYKAFDKPIPIGLATNGASTNALGEGSITIRFLPPDSPSVTYRISKAYYVPGIVNLISIRYLDDLGKRIQFSGKRIDIWSGNKLDLSVPRVGNTYRCRGEVILPDRAHAAKLPQASWHRR